MTPLELHCLECQRVTVLDSQAQRAILAELKLPAQRKIITCQCTRFEWGLGAIPKRREQSWPKVT
jgi:hypothetical protein